MLFKKIGLGEDLDEGCISLKNSQDVKEFIKQCAQLRFLKREERMMKKVK